jgi:hypothetical protein
MFRLFPFPSIPFGKNRHEQALHTYDYSTVYTYIYLKSKSFVKDIEFRSSSFSTPFCCGDRKKKQQNKTKMIDTAIFNF